MPIEIRELQIKVKIEEESNAAQQPAAINQLQLDELKSRIVKECTNKVLEILKEREER